MEERKHITEQKREEIYLTVIELLLLFLRDEEKTLNAFLLLPLQPPDWDVIMNPLSWTLGTVRRKVKPLAEKKESKKNKTLKLDWI